jgi:cold shock CspA family protein
MNVMVNGYIEVWTAKGYGWVLSDDGRKFFAHVRAFEPALPLGFVPVKGSLVEFDEGKTSRGPVALNIRIVKGAR